MKLYIEFPLTRFAPRLAALLLLQAALVCASARDDDLRKQATWSPRTAKEVTEQLGGWLDQQTVAAPLRKRALDAFAAKLEQEGALAAVAAAFAVVHEPSGAITNICLSTRPALAPATFPWLSSPDIDPFMAANLRLLLGRWLVQNEFYDEAMQHFGELTTSDVVDPAGLLFYRGVAHHRLLNKEECLKDIASLLEDESAVPHRFVAVAQLIAADIRPLREDSLDEISRLMEDIQRRLALGRAGKRVRDEENDVIAKLDKMIEEIEKQQQQQQASASGAGNSQSGRPADDSVPLGGSGPGDIDQRSIGSSSGWGNLPPKERQEALQQISKDLPAHFREVIEEYFRKLAREDGN